MYSEILGGLSRGLAPVYLLDGGASVRVARFVVFHKRSNIKKPPPLQVQTKGEDAKKN
jgi:hypothetical protein